MKRTELFYGAAALGLACTAAPLRSTASPATTMLAPLVPLAQGVPVAFLLAEGAVMIDFAGPWEVFQDAQVPGTTAAPFVPYFVAESTRPIAVSGGAKIVPNYQLATAPPPKVVVIPGLGVKPTDAMKTWLRAVARDADLMMSVCTGALALAETGLLDGHDATTHHGSLTIMAMEFPNVTVQRGARFVDNGRIATSAGLSAGIDLALHVVERYYGRAVARDTAYYMEYQGQGWLNAGSNEAYAKPPAPRKGYAICPVCWMNVDPHTTTTSTYRGTQYYFCMPSHKQRFDATPLRFLSAS